MNVFSSLCKALAGSNVEVVKHFCPSPSLHLCLVCSVSVEPIFYRNAVTQRGKRTDVIHYFSLFVNERDAQVETEKITNKKCPQKYRHRKKGKYLQYRKKIQVNYPAS